MRNKAEQIHMHCMLIGPVTLGCLLAVVSKGHNSDAGLTTLDYNVDRANYLPAQGIVYQHQDSKPPVRPNKTVSTTADGYSDRRNRI